MAQRLRLRLAAFGILVGLIVAAPAAVGSAGQPAELIVGFRDGVTPAEQDEVLALRAARVHKRWTRIDGVLASVSAGKMKATLRSLERDPRVEYAEPNYVLRTSTSDPHSVSFGVSRRSTRPKLGASRREAPLWSSA